MKKSFVLTKLRQVPVSYTQLFGSKVSSFDEPAIKECPIQTSSSSKNSVSARPESLIPVAPVIPDKKVVKAPKEFVAETQLVVEVNEVCEDLSPAAWWALSLP